jgi:dGTP triphosphohydrolase
MYHFYTNYPDYKQIVTDYISGMTDAFALDSIKQITIPKPISFL